MNLHGYSTAQLQQIACEQVMRLTDRTNPGNAGLANECLAEIVARESVAWEAGHLGPVSYPRVIAVISRDEEKNIVVRTPEVSA